MYAVTIHPVQYGTYERGQKTFDEDSEQTWLLLDRFTRACSVSAGRVHRNRQAACAGWYDVQFPVGAGVSCFAGWKVGGIWCEPGGGLSLWLDLDWMEP